MVLSSLTESANNAILNTNDFIEFSSLVAGNQEEIDNLTKQTYQHLL
ncbi:hypothetical protein [Flavivirga algicola]|uniref:Uncharacterized protein n=1 Tax=Flavivirga algicola TaxID=2729136 RepID=A0ABX1RWK9_9FLAO|nr:hypothetical protein [Flavivirga algicola]NMH87944.1 hypothetical protein [Flavivirga algicola]